MLLLATPINTFVDKQLMKKYIGPGIDQISHGFVNESRMKTIFNDMKEKLTNPDDKSAKTSNLIQKVKTPPELKSKAAESR